jgi:hypothetical protein
MMTSGLRKLWPSRLGLAVALLLLPTLVLAAGRRSKVPKPWQFNPDHKTVEMFQAIEKGQLDVKLIPQNSKRCQVMIENKTDRPLNVKLPEAFAGVPVLAQNLGGGGRGGGGNNSSNQSMGGGMGGMGGGGGGMGMFNIPPEKVKKFRVITVCLEHGKNEPRAAIPYEIRPIDSFTDKVEVHELCRILGSGELTQTLGSEKLAQAVAQVAAWHLSNNMSWQELAGKRYRFANGASRPYFTPQELQAGIQISTMATKLAEKRNKNPNQSDSASLRSSR